MPRRKEITLMNDKIMLSIHHKYAELIFGGKKTLEIRKTAPSGGSFPYIIYMYETKRDGGVGAVVGFFKCGAVIKTNAFGKALFSEQADRYRADIASRSCLTVEQLTSYANGNDIRGLVVGTPIRFPRPRPLSDFGLTRAPQSWQYLK